MTRRRPAGVLMSVVAVLGGASTNLAARTSSRPIERMVDAATANDAARLIVQLRDSSLRLRAGRLARVEQPVPARVGSGTTPPRTSAIDLAALSTIIDRVGVDLRPLFGTSEALFDAQHELAERYWGTAVPNKNSFYELLVAPRDQASTLTLLRGLAAVADVTVAPVPTPAPTTPDFTPLQRYRNASKPNGGLDVDALAGMPGGDGAGVTIADVEYSWNRSHEDLATALVGASSILIGTPIDPFSSDSHGTAVLGILAATADQRGVTGMAPGVSMRLVNTYGSLGYNPAAAISAAHAALQPGDVILVEQQSAGPNGCDANQVGCVPAEWDAAVYTAIASATAAGITVVEAAGNGWENLDDTTLYGTPFPAGRADSGALVVGAGTGCASTSHARLGYSNRGQRVDLQGWGECVFSSGFGDYWNAGPNATYTAAFGGTSAAAATVAGAAAALSAFAKHQGVTLWPSDIRSRLIATGAPAAPGAGIGPLPDLRAAVAMFLPSAVIDAPASITQRQVAAFSAARSTDPQGTPVTYAWDLDGDGAFDDGTASGALVHPSVSGPLTVRVKVTDGGGAFSFASATVTVQPSPRSPAGEVEPTTPAPTARSAATGAAPRTGAPRAAAPPA